MSGRAGKSVEQIYKKMTQLEHVLNRPDSYVGSVEMLTDRMWVWDSEKDQMVFRQVSYVPALYKIFDEILVNAADNIIRDPTMDHIKIDIDPENCCIKVWNNGKGIPIQMHKEHNVYVPELVFGHLLTSDNYDDNEKKVTGGRNGYGAKLTNIFSTKFVIRTADAKHGKLYKQVFENNMGKKSEPAITSFEGDDFTEVVFYPELARFKMARLDEDIIALFTKRAYDVAGTSGKRCKVSLNGKRLPVKDFKDYADLYLKVSEGQPEPPRIHEKCGDRWEIVVSLSDAGDGQFQQVSFVNAIATSKGGTHVNHVADQISEVILKKVQAKNKGGMEIKSFHVKNHLWVFVNCLIENPAFISQTKESLSTSVSQFGSRCVISESTLNKIQKSGIVEQVLEWAKFKQQSSLHNKLKANTGNSTRVHGIPKLEDANDAGGRNSDKCTLILTEGDSAKALAVAGLGVVGRDHFGVFPLRGKLLNVRDATYKQIIENKEIQALLKIVGLDPKKQYDSVKGLRYGSIMIMTDQDHDGSHIKGLFLNFVNFWWPSLCKLPGFIKEFVTPIVKCTKANRIVQFFTLTEYENWKRENNEGRGWQMKYYKGLGTNTSQEAKEYFSRIDQHKIAFQWRDEGDGERIDMAFNKARADDRKEWINNYEEGVCVDHAVKHLRYRDFIDKELVQFSKYDVMRSIPSVVDGFKPAQRKVIYCCFKRNLNSDVKVAQFIGYVSEQSAYHHGEQSLEATIIGMAQNFVGSNNINLLVPSGQFGTRLQGGKDAASARYIYTRLCSWTREIFNSADDPLLEYQTEEGQNIEPVWYCPVIPMVLVNGAEGIGTGWSTSVPCYNPREIINIYRDFLRGHPLKNIDPWYDGFSGSVECNDKSGFDFCGRISVLDEKTIQITELPIKTWTQGYKEFLQDLLPGAEKAKEKEKDAKKGAAAKDKDAPVKVPPIQLVDIKEYHTENTVSFKLILTPEKLQQAQALGLEKVFKLRTKVSTTNMVLFDRRGKIRRYDTPLEVMEEFSGLRLEMYEKRKAHLIAVLNREISILRAKVEFILAVLSGKIVFNNKKIADILTDLRVLGFKPLSDLSTDPAPSTTSPSSTAAAADSDETSKSGFDYLLGQPLWTLTLEKVQSLQKSLRDKSIELEKISATSPEEMWDRDLARLLYSLDARDAQRELDKNSEKQTMKAAKSGSSSSASKLWGKSSEPGELPEVSSLKNGKLEFDPSAYARTGAVVTVERKEFEYKQQNWRKEKKETTSTSAPATETPPGDAASEDSDGLPMTGFLAKIKKRISEEKQAGNGAITKKLVIDSSSDDDVPVVARPARAAAEKAKPALADSDLESFISSDSDEVVKSKPAKKTKPAAANPKPKAKPAAAPKPKAKAAPKPKAKAAPKKRKSRDDTDEGSASGSSSSEDSWDDDDSSSGGSSSSDMEISSDGSEVEEKPKKKLRKVAVSSDDD